MGISARQMALAIAISATVSGSALAQAQPQPAPPEAAAACPQPGAANAQVVVITKPDWVRRPDGDEVREAYPAMAFKEQKSDETTIDCTVSDDGRLANCRVLNDKRPGAGFDKSAMKLARIYRMAPLSSIPEYANLPDCFRKAGPPHVLIPMSWRP
jgi:protein TonB